MSKLSAKYLPMAGEYLGGLAQEYGQKAKDALAGAIRDNPLGRFIPIDLAKIGLPDLRSFGRRVGETVSSYLPFRKGGMVNSRKGAFNYQ